MSEGIFIITDGTIGIDMLKLFCLIDWTPATPAIKGEGTWRSSPFAQGRQQVLREYDNVIENMTWIAKGHQSIDQLIRNTQDLRRLLEKAASYWLQDWQNEPVWIETRGICETNPRYAVIHDYRAPGDDNPFAPPFTTSGIFADFTLILEHSIWQDSAPGSPACVEVAGYSQGWCFPHYLAFEDATDEVDCGSNAILDDLPTGDFTVDGWIYADSYGGSNTGRIIDKDRLYIYLGVSNGLGVFADFTGNDAFAISGLDDLTADGEWHHIAVVFDSGTNFFDLYIDGIKPSYLSRQAGTVAYNSDAAQNFMIGNDAGNSYNWDGKIGWLRLSSGQRFLADFDAAIPPKCTLPAIDAATLAVWIYEGTGNTADNLEGTAALDGTITGAAWGCDCECG